MLYETGITAPDFEQWAGRIVAEKHNDITSRIEFSLEAAFMQGVYYGKRLGTTNTEPYDDWQAL